MKLYRKKPVVIEAIQLLEYNFVEVEQFIGYETTYFRCYETDSDLNAERNPSGILINTLEGIMQARIGDYIIRGVKGEYYPCKPDIFIQTYDEV